MLVLTRKTGQRIIIGNEIVITVVETRGERVRLGITAPPEMPIHREEVYIRIGKEDYQRVER